MAEEAMTELLRVSDLSLTFGSHRVLHGLQLALASGERLAILGRSGAGKSTLLRCLAALEQADTGFAWIQNRQYMLDGTIVVPPWDLRREVGSERLVLVERDGLGRTEQFTETELATGAPGDIVPVRIVGHTRRHLVAEAA